MKAHWVSYVLGFLCGPAGVTLSTLTVFQDPPFISLMRVNSTAEITCSTSESDPVGLALYRSFPEMDKIMHVNIKKGLVDQNTFSPGFEGRVHVARRQQIGESHSFTFELSLLGLEDTNVYSCVWEIIGTESAQNSAGTIVIIREKDPQEQCREHMFDRILFALSVTALFIVVILCIGALIVRCKRIKRRFRPAAAATPPRPNRPQYVCPHQQVQHRPYLITSLNSTDVRGILQC